MATASGAVASAGEFVKNGDLPFLAVGSFAKHRQRIPDKRRTRETTVQQSPIPPTPDPAHAAPLRRQLEDLGYRREAIGEVLGGVEAPIPGQRDLPRLLALTTEPNPQNLLIRALLGGVSLPMDDARRVLGETCLGICQQAGVLEAADAQVHPRVLLVPMEDWWIAADTYAQLASPGAYHHVLAVNPAARHLLNFTLRDPADSALDLGCGCGIQALALSRHCDAVSATDLNPRAAGFTAFNAALNGIDNIRCLTGDLFQPVAGESFQRIVCNPPFVLTPDRQFLYRDNDLELDQLCQRILREGPALLAPGGILQMILEWVETEDQPWQERLAGWCQDLGCDVWIFHQYRQEPSRYALSRLKEMPPTDPAEDQAHYQRWLDYYRKHGIRAMHSGLIALRRRDGDNWLEVEDVEANIQEPFGHLLARRFRHRDFLATGDWQRHLLEARPRLAPEARMVHQYLQEGGEWRTLSMRLQSAPDFPKALGVDAQVAQFLGGLKGEQTLAQALAVLAASVRVDRARLEAECLGTMRYLLLRGLVEL